MKIVIQRVLHSSVDVEGRVVGQTGQGLCCLVGVGHDDSIMDAEWICRKLLNLKLWPDETGKPWQRSVMDLDGGVLLISQFTLFATLKGNKPDYHLAMGTGAREFFERFVAMVRQAYKAERVSTGEFGAMMKVHIDNDGPVTICLDSKDVGLTPASASQAAKNARKQGADAAGDEATGAAAETTPEGAPQEPAPISAREPDGSMKTLSRKAEKRAARAEHKQAARQQHQGTVPHDHPAAASDAPPTPAAATQSSPPPASPAPALPPPTPGEQPPLRDPPTKS